MKSRLRPVSLIALTAILLTFPPAAAQREYQYQEEGYQDDGIRQSVARISHFEGAVSFNRGDSPDDWQPASLNYPMTLGDRIWTDRNSRVELELPGGTVYLGPETELAALDLTRDVRQLSLALGRASFRIRRMDRDEVFEVATPNVSVTFETPGSYRVDVDEEGNSRVTVYQGRAWAAAAGGQVELERGDRMRVFGIDQPDYDLVSAGRGDVWDRWVDGRERRHRSVRSASYVHPDIYGSWDLDAYGSWENDAEYGSVWYPRGVAAGWEPYRSGRWIWRDPWGWTWLSSEPWGWAPYHYGRWAMTRGRWGWVPVGPGGRRPGYSPALVGFVGGGSGWSVSVSVSAGGFIGWFPLGPREPFHPWWYQSRSTSNVAGYDYAYRSRATVVSATVFVGGGAVDRGFVRDRRVLSQVVSAPVLRGPIPILPTRDSIRPTGARLQGRGSTRPPERLGTREVVTRTAPPPAPPTFERKLDVIRERGGGPVTTEMSRRLSVEQNRGEKSARPVRPAARDEVLLAPRGEVQDSRRPQPLPPTETRRPASVDRPPLGREATPSSREPGPRGVAEPARPTAAPRGRDVPAAPPATNRAPASTPELRREEPPSRAVETPVARRRGVPGPTQQRLPVHQVAPTPEPQVTREPAPAQPALEARRPTRSDVPRPPARERERAEPRPDPGRPDVVEPKKDETEKGKGKPTPKPKRRRGDPEPEKDPEKKIDR